MKITKSQLRQIIREEVQRAKALPRLSEKEEKSLVKDLNDRVAKMEQQIAEMEKDIHLIFGAIESHDIAATERYRRDKDVKMRLDTLETLVDAPKKAEKNVPDPLREDK